MEVAGKFMPSFVQLDDGSYVQTPETEKVITFMQGSTDTPLQIEPLVDVKDLDGDPLMEQAFREGALDGYASNITGKAFVVPSTSPTVVAHELAHQGLKSKLMNDVLSDQHYRRIVEQLNDPRNFTPEMRDKGATMRLFYEAFDKPHLMLEEANAQGVAVGFSHG